MKPGPAQTYHPHKSTILCQKMAGKLLIARGMRFLTIREFSSSTVTRTKANEAYRNLTQYIA
ncbi:MAG TPA: hypothetical protein VFD18_03165, partial [Chthoniobacterales bacterium]|nr:hypothetical protein [Chthoniobacterales bacterium]